MKLEKRLLRVILCAILVGLAVLPTAAQQSVGKYFEETGHNVVGEFWAFYQNTPNASIIFGLPITEQFITADGSGLTVQYFERARFELHPNLPVGQRVQVTPLGERLYQPGTSSVNYDKPGACRVINGFGVCYEFLAFFEYYGGIASFGRPISAHEFQNDKRIVQHFEKARLVWHPENPAGRKVELANLGQLYFNLYEDPAWLNPAPPIVASIKILPITSLKARAFVAKASTHPTDTQKINIVVSDQLSRPVGGASGKVTVHLPDGRDMTYLITTNSNGIGTVDSISFANQPVGKLVTIDVQVSYQGLTAKTTASFRIWR